MTWPCHNNGSNGLVAPARASVHHSNEQKHTNAVLTVPTIYSSSKLLFRTNLSLQKPLPVPCYGSSLSYSLPAEAFRQAFYNGTAAYLYYESSYTLPKQALRFRSTGVLSTEAFCKHPISSNYASGYAVRKYSFYAVLLSTWHFNFCCLEAFFPLKSVEIRWYSYPPLSPRNTFPEKEKRAPNPAKLRLKDFWT
jgi:hypothetical protein